MITSKTPGKLFIGGEYAITQPGSTAILVAVNRFIDISLEKASKIGSIEIYKKTIGWQRLNGRPALLGNDTRLKYILGVISIVEEYAVDLGKELSHYHIKVDSQLETEDGIKYGLGSSSAVTVGLTEALCKHYGIEISQERLFKLSALASLSINKNGSCGDIAACVYGGWIAYSSFDREKIINEYPRLGVSKVLEMEWPHFKIRYLDPPKDLHLAIGWTGKPASTINLVDMINKKKENKEQIYKEFLNGTRLCMDQMIKAFDGGDTKGIQKQIHENRRLLLKMTRSLGVELEVPKLKLLSQIGEKYGASGKFSGAGGGDCGIVILNHEDKLASIIKEWEESGIIHLPLEVFFK